MMDLPVGSQYFRSSIVLIFAECIWDTSLYKKCKNLSGRNVNIPLVGGVLGKCRKISDT